MEQSNHSVIAPAELMTTFRKMVSSSMDDLLDNVVSANACLENEDRRGSTGSASYTRKAKSLVARWLNKTSNIASARGPDRSTDDIERDTVVAANVTVGRGARKMTFLKQYRVLDIHDKYYNKWFMSKETSKKWKRDAKFKLKVRMQEVNAIQEYEDVSLGDERYEKKHVSEILSADEIVRVVGKLQ